MKIKEAVNSSIELVHFLRTHKLNEKGKRTLLIGTSVFLLGCSVQTAILAGKNEDVANGDARVTKKLVKKDDTKKVITHTKKKDNSYAELKGDLQPKHRLELEKLSDQHSKFFSKLAPDAIKLGKQYRIYPSVMLAQAAIESNFGNSTLAKAPNNNYFGIKGSYKGQSVNLPTTEYTSTGVRYTINANFAKYPSVYKSLESNAKLLRNGIDGNSNIYQGAWKSNAKNFYQATYSLSKNYATSPVYAQTLNKVIQVYDLNQFD